MSKEQAAPLRSDNVKQQLCHALAASEQQQRPVSFVAINGLFVEVNVNGTTSLTIWRRRASDLTVTDWRRFVGIWPYPLELPNPDKKIVIDERTGIKRTVWSAAWATPPRLLDAPIDAAEIER